MSYVTVNDLKLYFDKRILVKITNDDPTVNCNDDGNIVQSVVEAYIADSEHIISNYFRYTYTDTDVNDTPTEEIKTICAQLTYCNLWRRRGSEPTQVTDLRKECYDRLHRMSIPSTDQVRENTNKSKIGVDNRL